MRNLIGTVVYFICQTLLLIGVLITHQLSYFEFAVLFILLLLCSAVLDLKDKVDEINRRIK